MLPEIYQVILTNFGGRTIYSGVMKDIAFDMAMHSGFECSILLDGALVATHSPISGWKYYNA